MPGIWNCSSKEMKFKHSNIQNKKERKATERYGSSYG